MALSFQSRFHPAGASRCLKNQKRGPRLLTPPCSWANKDTSGAGVLGRYDSEKHQEDSFRSIQGESHKGHSASFSHVSFHQCQVEEAAVLPSRPIVAHLDDYAISLDEWYGRESKHPSLRHYERSLPWFFFGYYSGCFGNDQRSYSISAMVSSSWGSSVVVLVSVQLPY